MTTGTFHKWNSLPLDLSGLLIRVIAFTLPGSVDDLNGLAERVGLSRRATGRLIAAVAELQGLA